MAPPRFQNPHVPVTHANKWDQLKLISNANQMFTPVEIKAYYVIGLIDDICQSVQCLINSGRAWPDYYLPAFSLFASSVDLLGRCITGNTTFNINQNLRVGFWFLFHPNSVPPPRTLNPSNVTTVVVTTSQLSYTVEDLINMRHFSSHGQAVQRNLPSVDNTLLEQFPAPLGAAIETYWSALQNNAEYCRRLGIALIDPYANRADPLIKIINYFSQGQAAGDLFYRLNWHV